MGKSMVKIGIVLGLLGYLGSFSYAQETVKLTSHQLNVISGAYAVGTDGILFISDRDGTIDLYKIELNGSNTVRLTNNSALEYEAAISPDGNKIAYASTENWTTSKLYVMDINTKGSTLTVTADGEIEDIQWSRNGQKIGYTLGSDTEQGWKKDVYVVDVQSGSVTQISNDGHSYEFSLSPDGSKIAYPTWNSTNPAERGIFIKNTDGTGEPTLLVQDGESPLWSPNDNWIAYRFHEYGEGNGIGIINSDGSTQAILTTYPSGYIDILDWANDSSRIFYSVNMELYAVGTSGNSTQLNSPHSRVFSGISFPPDENYIVYDNLANIFKLNLTGVPGVTNLTNNPLAGLVSTPRWSPDGEKLGYIRIPDSSGLGIGVAIVDKTGQSRNEIVSGAGDDLWDIIWAGNEKIIYETGTETENGWLPTLYAVDVNNSSTIQLTTDGGYSPSVGSNTIVYSGSVNNNWGICRMDLDGTNQTFITDGGDPAISPDGSKIAYTNWYPSGLFLIPSAGGTPATLTTANAQNPVWAPNNNIIAYTVGNEIWVVKLATLQTWRVATATTYYIERICFSPDSQYLAYVDEINIWTVKINGSELKQINPPNTFAWDVDWSSQNMLAYCGLGGEGRPAPAPPLKILAKSPKNLESSEYKSKQNQQREEQTIFTQLHSSPWKSGDIQVLNMGKTPSIGSITVYDTNGNLIGTYATIQAGVNTCPIGGTVSVSAGIYTEVVYINKGIALVGVGTPTIDASGLGTDTNSVTFEGTATDRAIISGFRITGATGDWPYGSGIFCGTASPTITNNIITKNGFGIFCGFSSSLITNNIISGNNYSGIISYCSSPFIINNIISENNEDGIFSDFSSPFITNNTISRNKGDGIYSADSSSPTITNNIITENSTTNSWCYGIDVNSGTPTINYNCVWGNGLARTQNYGNCTAGSYDISLDPQFIGNGDFHLQSTSPCIDKGTNTAPGIQTTDKDGNPRIYNNYIVDMGAYEYQGIFITYDATDDFSISRGNPNGVWSYGWMPNDFSTFILYTGSFTNSFSSPQWYREPNLLDWTPCIWRNDDSTSHDGVAPGQLSLHPSHTYEASVLRWTAPFNGLYHIDGQFFSGDIGTIQVGIRQGSIWLWQASNSGIFNLNKSMMAGNSIDFLVYGSCGCGNTPLEVTISSSSDSLPSQIGTITGTIFYSGTKTGSLYIGVFTSPQMSGDPLYETEVGIPTFPQTYIIPNLPDGTYYVRAFRDADNNKSPSIGDPIGIYGSLSAVYSPWQIVGTPTPVQVAVGSLTPGIDFALTQEIEKTPKEWTFMVYLDGDNDLENAAIDDFLEMAQVGSNDKINIVVQFDRINSFDDSHGDWKTTKRFYITKGLTPASGNALCDIGEVNMAAPQTVIDFVDWAKTNYPAQKYAFVFWNHGGGWRVRKQFLTKAVCWDDTSDGDCLYMSEVKEALAERHLDLIGFDACLMGMVEVAYQIKDSGDVAVFSQEEEPDDGWPYNTILADLAGTPTMTAEEFGKVIVERYMESYNEEPVTQSAVNLKKIGPVATQITNLANKLEYYYDELRNLRAVTDDYRSYADIYHFADLVSSSIPDESIKDSAEQLKSAIKGCVIAEGHKNYHPDFHGMNIYFPQEKDKEYDDYVKNKVVDFPNYTTWDEFLVRFINPGKIPVIKPLYRIATGTSYTVEWSSVAGANYYELQESASNWQTIGTFTVTSTIITGKSKEGYYNYRVRAICGNNIGNWSNSEDIWVGENAVPEITITNPPAEGTTADNSFTIEFTAVDPDDTARINLYYDTNNEGFDGIFITSLPEADGVGSYTWNTLYIPNGNYYLYCLINDGKLRNPPVGTYSPGALSIKHGTKSWNFLVYLDGDNNLEPFALDDIEIMKQVGSTEDVNIFVQMDGMFTHPDTKRYYILKGEAKVIAELGEVNMGDPETVIDFATEVMAGYPAANTAFVFMNHGGGWRDKDKLREMLKKKAVCWDETNGEDCLYMSEVKDAFENISRKVGQRINVVGFDACLMAMTEVAYQLKDVADVMAASEEVEFAPGWPYGLILTELTGTPTLTPKELGKTIVAKYAEYYTNPEILEANITTQSAIDLSKMSGFSGTITNFADSITDNWDKIKEARGFVSYSDWRESYIDLYHFADIITNNSGIAEGVKEKAETIKTRIKDAVILNYAREGHPNFHGLSIYFPQTRVDEEYNDYAVDKVIDFPHDTKWDEFLARYCKSILPALFTGSFTDTGIDSEDGDTLLDYLQLSLEINVKEGGTYGINGGLSDYEGKIEIGRGGWTEPLFLSPGTYTIDLSFNGRNIFACGIDGPYRFNVELFDEIHGEIDGFGGYTGTYTYTQFEKQGLFTGTWTDYGTDTNNNGLYDFLVMETEVLIPEDDVYEVSGGLAYSPDALFSFTWICEEMSLKQGTQTVKINFSGTDIWNGKIDGPYFFELNFYSPKKGATYTTKISGVTGSYTYTQFEMPCAFTGDYKDYGTDTNNNGLYDYLVIETEVLIPEAGWYNISGSLRDKDGNNWIADAGFSGQLSSGTHTIPLNFKGRNIWDSNIDGPYLFNLYIYTYKGKGGTYTTYLKGLTGTYTYTQFEGPGVFTGNWTDYGTDTNNNGLYDYLVIETEVLIPETGWCDISGILMDKDGWKWIVDARFSGELSSGTHTIPLNFKGRSIWDSKIDGPYLFNLYIYTYKGKGGSYTTHLKDLTGTYTYTQFEMPGVFTGIWTDYGTDTNNNSLYDYLVIETEVLIPDAGWYDISGSLYDKDGWTGIAGARFSGELSSGTQTIALNFKGRSIWDSKIDGPYRFKLGIYGHYKQATYTIYLEGITGTYTYTQFECPAVFTGDYKDYGTDTNNNGLYDYLVIETEVLIPAAGTYNISGSLRNKDGNNWIVDAGFSGQLSPGTQTIVLNFKGTKIWNSGIDGPYRFNLWIDSPYRQATYTTNLEGITGTYTYTQFESSIVAISGEPVDNTKVSWVTGGDAFWFAQTATYYYDGDAAQSGKITHNQQTYIQTIVTGPASLKFYWKVSSESNYDYLRFYIDNAEMDKISGEVVDWQRKGYSIPSGTHTLKWAYTKDGSVDRGSDCGWLDFVSLTQPGVFTGTWTDYGTDTNNNSLYDYLVIETEVLIPEAGWYEISGSLNDKDGRNWITNAGFSGQLSPGTQTIVLNFEGREIWRSGIDGPYLFNLDIYRYRGKGGSYTTELQGLTGTYTHTQFEMPGVFTGDYKDYGTDTNYNGLYDYLVIETEVLIPEAGKYGISGNLSGKEGWNLITYTWFSEEFTPGTHTIMLNFKGRSIWDSKIDGPYLFSLDIYTFNKGKGGSYTTYLKGLTGTYTYTQFEGPKIDLWIYKSGPYTAISGEEMVYYIKYGNNGDTYISGIITDILPAGVTYISDTSDLAVEAPGRKTETITWEVESLAPESYEEFKLIVKVDKNATGTLVNVVKIATLATETAYINNISTWTTTLVPPIVDLSIEKKGLSVVKTGERMRYQITYRNLGNMPVKSATITDTLPGSVTYHGDTLGNETQSGNQIIWQVGPIAAGEGGYFEVFVGVDQDAEGTLTNVIEISTPAGDIKPANNRSTWTTCVIGSNVDLAIYKWGSWGVVTGGEVTYYINYYNFGNSEVAAATIKDFLPASFTYISSSIGSPTITGSGTTQNPYILEWQVGTVSPGYYYGYGFNFTAKVGDDVVRYHDNVVEILSPGDYNPQNNRATATTKVETPIADLLIQKSGPKEAIPGETITYWMWYRNQGNVPAEDVTITDYIPKGVTYVSSSGTPSAISATGVSWDVGTVTGWGGWFELTVMVETDAVGPLVNVIEIKGTPTLGTDPLWNNRATWTTTINVPTVDLRVNKYTKKEVMPGEELEYVIEYGNDGNTIATNTVITDYLPTGTTYVSHTSNFPVEISIKDVDVKWKVGTVNPDSGGRFILTVRVGTNASTTFLTNVVVISSTVENNHKNNRATATTSIVSPTVDLGIKKLAPIEVSPSQEMVYRLSYRNNGNTGAGNVTITDSLPSGVNYVSDTSGVAPTTSGQTISWQLGTVAPTGWRSFEVVVSVGYLAPNTILTNVVEINDITGLESYKIDNRATAATKVVAPITDVAVHKQGPEEVVSGGKIVYHIGYGNVGNTPAGSVTITDTLPLGVIFVGDNSGFPTSTMGNQITWSLGTLSPGAKGRFDVSAKISELPASSTFTNIIEIKSITYDDNSANNIASATLHVVAPTTDLRIHKFGPKFVAVGQNMTYEISYGNYGNSQANEVDIIDTLPDGMIYQSDTSGIPYNLNGNTVIWHIAGIPNGGFGSFKLITSAINVSASTTLTNTINITTLPNDINPNNNLSTWQTHVVDERADVTIWKYGSGARPGFDKTYYITYQNIGTGKAEDVVIVDTLPEEVKYLSSNPAGNYDSTNHTVSWNIGSLNGNTSGNITLYVNVQWEEVTVNETLLKNIVEITTTSPEMNSNNNKYVEYERVVGAIDPNDKLASPQEYVSDERDGKVISYTIRFENVATATLPAKKVTIIDKLDANFDMNTLVPSDIGIGTRTYQIGPWSHGTAYGTISYTLSGGTITWCLEGDTIPASVTTGFLPPNDTSPEGEGYVSYSVRVKGVVQSGTIITNKANIKFDFDPNGIDTPEVSHTLDLDKPTSTVTTPKYSTSTTFLVSWAGLDTVGTISDYTIYYAVDNPAGSYTAWITGTTATQAYFTGEKGHTYYFYSVAKDKAGNMQDASSSPRSQTPVIDSIKIVNQGDIEVGTLTMRAGETLPLYALGYCGTTAVAYLTSDWDIEGASIGNLSPTTGTTTVLTAITIGSATIKAVISGGTLTDSTDMITVVGGTVTSITISPATKTLTADEFATYTAMAKDAHNNLWDVTGQTAFTTTDPKGTFAANDYNPGQAGQWIITGSHNGVEGTAAVTVIPGALKYVRIEDFQGSETTNYSMPTDGTLTLYSRGYDADGNLVGDVIGTWSVTNNIGDVAPQVGTHTTFDAKKVGTGTIKVAVEETSGDETGIITVGVGGLNYVRIENLARNPIGTHSMTTDGTLDLYCRGYDADNNLIGDVSGTWTVSGNIGNVAPQVGTQTTFDAKKPGTDTINVNDGVGHSDTTDVITVNIGALHHVRIEDLGGSKIGTQSMTTDGTLMVYCRGYDADDNLIGEVSGSWTVSGNIGDVAPQVGTHTTFDAKKSGTGTIKVDDGAGHSDTTDAITVTVGAVNYVKIENQAGTEIGTYSMTTDETLTLYFRGYDVDNNLVGYVNGTWTVTGNIGDVLPVVGTKTTFYARKTGTGSIRGEDNVGHFNETGLITVSFAGDLSKAFAYPNPYYANKGGYIWFGELTENSTIQIFTIAGELVYEIKVQNSPQRWDTRNDAGEKVASGIYIYLIKDPAGNKKVGKLGVLR